MPSARPLTTGTPDTPRPRPTRVGGASAPYGSPGGCRPPPRPARPGAPRARRAAPAPKRTAAQGRRGRARTRRAPQAGRVARARRPTSKDSRKASASPMRSSSAAASSWSSGRTGRPATRRPRRWVRRPAMRRRQIGDQKAPPQAREGRSRRPSHGAVDCVGERLVQVARGRPCRARPGPRSCAPRAARDRDPRPLRCECGCERRAAALRAHRQAVWRPFSCSPCLRCTVPLRTQALALAAAGGHHPGKHVRRGDTVVVPSRPQARPPERARPRRLRVDAVERAAR